MSFTLFFNLLQSTEKSIDLLNEVRCANSGALSRSTHLVSVDSFRNIPGTPFGYWVSDSIRALFRSFPPFQSDSKMVRVGLQTSDDFRFVRGWWEVPSSTITEGTSSTTQQDFVQQTFKGKKWVTLSKGGGASAFAAEFYLVVNWAKDGEEMKELNNSLHGNSGWSRNIRSTDCYFLSGLSWAVRTRRFNPYVVPSGGIFSVSRYQAFMPQQDRLWILALLNCDMTTLLLRLCSERYEHPKFIVGIVAALPFPVPPFEQKRRLEHLAERGIAVVLSRSTANEMSRNFELPHLLQVKGDTLSEMLSAWRARLENWNRELAVVEKEINEIGRELYGVTSDQAVDVPGTEESLAHGEEDTEEGEPEPEERLGELSDREYIAQLCSYLVGSLLGRWKVELTRFSAQPTPSFDPWQPLPVSSPGMLACSRLRHTTESSASSPLHPIASDGIIVDDSEHRQDMVRRVRETLELIWKGQAEAIEQEISKLLGVRELRDYFRKPSKGGFWEDHVARYTKSRRKAPIYWLLQSSKKSYALWLYYHRLDKDLLFKTLVNYVEPKIRLETSRLETPRDQKAAAGVSGKEAKRIDKELERQEDLLSELRDFEDRLRRAANLHLEPDLNDGVVLNIAPLWELVPWKEPKNYWDELLKGEYEWSSIGKQLRQRGLVK
jgi:hypothetical protein